MIPTLQQIALTSPSRGASRLALLALLLEADEGGCCTASTERLAALAGCRRNHVSRAMQKLVAAGEVAVEPGRGPNRHNLYRVLCARSFDAEQSHDGADEPSTPPPTPPSAEDPLDAIHRLRAEAWAAFDPHGRPWHHASDAERDAFANSEHGRAFHVSAQTFATQAGVSVSATGEIKQSSL
jgi:hypothetical protein